MIDKRFRYIAALLFLAATVQADPTTDANSARKLLEFCVAHPEACSISIDYQKGNQKWSVDYNGSRLNPLASTLKVVHLLAYVDAVSQHRIDPGQMVRREDWTQFWVGHDGGALATAYARLSTGQPTPPLSVTNNQIVSAMIRESDNSAPDYLLNKLGSRYFAGIVDRYITDQHIGYVDLPRSLNAIFAAWGDTPQDPAAGIHALNNSSGYATDSWQDQVDDQFATMHNSAVVAAIRQYNGVLFPWIAGPPPPAQNSPLNELQIETLEKAYTARSNTRTYNQLLLRLLHRDLLPAAEQKLFEEFFEYKLTQVPPNPDLANLVRYGVKDGDFATGAGYTVRTRSIYAQTNDGTSVVFTVHLTGTPGTATDLGALQLIPPGSSNSPVKSFALAMVTNPAFAVEVQNALARKQDQPAPVLIAGIVENHSTPNRIRLTVNVTNIGTLATSKPLSLGVFSSTDGKLRGNEVAQKEFRTLQPGESVEIELDSRVIAPTRFLVLVVDPANAIPESQKQDNPQFETTRDR